VKRRAAFLLRVAGLSATLVGEHLSTRPWVKRGPFHIPMSKKVAVMLDGGHLRVYARKAGKTYDPAYIERIAHACIVPPGEEMYRVLYYDCAPFEGTATLPVSGTRKSFSGSDQWLRDLAKRDLFAVRRGTLKFRGFILKKIPYTPTAPLTDADFKADFEQKGVDMRIGLDMAIFSANRAVEMIVIATNDTDCIPAMKHARRSGIQVALGAFSGYSPAPEILHHVDFYRRLAWP